MGNTSSRTSSAKTSKLKPGLPNWADVEEGYASWESSDSVCRVDCRLVTPDNENPSNTWVHVEYDSDLYEEKSADKEEKFVKDIHIRELFRPLTEKEEAKIFSVLQSEKSSEILAVHEPSNIEITTNNIKCLSPSVGLNDEVINLYLELLKEREKREPERFLKCHFFNTFFYKKLTNGRTGYDFEAVRRWTSHRKLGYYLTECDKIFFPICKHVHWCLAVLDVKKKTFHYLDSLGAVDTHVLNILARYISDEVRDKSNQEMDITTLQHESVDNLPRQMNAWDCGMFMLKYCDFYSRGLDLCFGQEHMEYFRKRTVLEILNLRAD